MLRFMRRVLHRRDPSQQLREALRRPIGQCPVCQGELEGHLYWDIGSAEVGSNGEKKLGEVIAAGLWADAVQYQQANALQDILVWRAVKCVRGGVSLFPIILSFEIWAEDKAGAPIVLNEAESAQLTSLAGDRWRPL